MFEIPAERLPPGFAETVDREPANPATPQPAATVILIRDSDRGPEALLMRRHRSSGFVPGAWVFPGGRVDSADSGPGLHERIDGIPAAGPPPAFWTAAIREVFEETGVFLGRAAGGAWAADASSDRRMESLRRQLMEDEITLLDVMDEAAVELDTAGLVHMAHWITPVVEPRRYDTHFFLAALPDGRTARPDPREMTEAAWLRPEDALLRFEAGDLPMVFPTVKTLESLRRYDSVQHALAAVRSARVPSILPRLVRTETGVAIIVDRDKEA